MIKVLNNKMLHIYKDVRKSVGVFGTLHSSDSLQRSHVQSFSSLCFTSNI